MELASFYCETSVVIMYICVAKRFGVINGVEVRKCGFASISYVDRIRVPLPIFDFSEDDVWYSFGA